MCIVIFIPSTINDANFICSFPVSLGFFAQIYTHHQFCIFAYTCYSNKLYHLTSHTLSDIYFSNNNVIVSEFLYISSPSAIVHNTERNHHPRNILFDSLTLPPFGTRFCISLLFSLHVCTKHTTSLHEQNIKHKVFNIKSSSPSSCFTVKNQ